MNSTIDQLSTQLEAVKKRRGEMVAEHADCKRLIDSQMQTAGADLLGGKQAELAFDSVTKNKVKLEGLEIAIVQADKKIKELERAIDHETTLIKVRAFNKQLSDGQETASNLLVLLYDVADGIDELAKINAPSNYTPDEFLHFNNLLGGLKNLNIRAFLIGLENQDYFGGGKSGAYSIAQARSKKKP